PRLPAALRQFRGFVPVDVYLKTDVPELQAAACTRFAINQARFASGEVAESLGQLAGTLGTLALAAPNDPSPAVPGFTNLQASLLVAEATFTFFPPGAAPVPFYHFSGGTFDANGVPSGLSYSRPERFLSFLAGASPWQPLAELRDADAATCAGPPAPDVGWDDALGEIRVPVLYLGAGGGFGSSGLYTTTLLASADVSSRVVSLVPPEARLFDLGHADIFLGEDATGLFWQPLLSWVLAH
ncbi:MAG TPA: hypothetical protein PK413_09445, partial [Thermoanaerobaculia bacterium]|nr:hypothetical protein [Thermoanaerobaculia bacterium]